MKLSFSIKINLLKAILDFVQLLLQKLIAFQRINEPSLQPEVDLCLCRLGGALGCCFGWFSSINGISGSSKFNVNVPDIGIVKLAVMIIGEDLLLISVGSSLEPLSTLLLRPSSFRRLLGLFGLRGLGPISPPNPALWCKHCSRDQTFRTPIDEDTTLSSTEKFSASLPGSTSSVHCLKFKQIASFLILLYIYCII